MKHTPQMYSMMFDALLSEELSFSSTSATEANIHTAIKRVLGRSIKNDCIVSYSELTIDGDLNVHFKLKDPDGEIIALTLFYGA